MADSTLRQYDETASTADASSSIPGDVWAILGYELVPDGTVWAAEANVLEQQDVQDALAEGLRELRGLREQHDTQ